jgi:hypothetical protein
MVKMDYILTTKPVKYSGYEVVSSISEIGRLTMKSVLIVESYTDRDFDFVVFLLNALRDTSLTKLAYISENPSRILLEIMRTVGAFVAQDSSLIDTTEQFSELLEYLMSNTTSTYSEELDELADSFTTLDNYVRGKLESEPKILQRKVLMAHEKVSDALQDIVFSEDLTQELQSFLLTASSKIKIAEDELDKKEKELSLVQSSGFGGFGSINAYTQFSYTGNSKVLVIKEESPTRYLTSFLASYIDWLTRVPELNAKLLIIDKDSDFVDTRYKSLKKADSKTIVNNSSTLYLVPIIYTTTPTQSVMSNLMSPVVDLYVILDRTYKRTLPVSGRGISTVYSLSSRRLMRDLGLNSEDVIVNDLGEHTQLGVLAQIEGYAMDEGSRILQQQSAFEPIMKRLTVKAGFNI